MLQFIDLVGNEEGVLCQPAVRAARADRRITAVLVDLLAARRRHGPRIQLGLRLFLGVAGVTARPFVRRVLSVRAVLDGADANVPRRLGDIPLAVPERAHVLADVSDLVGVRPPAIPGDIKSGLTCL